MCIHKAGEFKEVLLKFGMESNFHLQQRKSEEVELVSFEEHNNVSFQKTRKRNYEETVDSAQLKFTESSRKNGLDPGRKFNEILAKVCCTTPKEYEFFFPGFFKTGERIGKREAKKLKLEIQPGTSSPHRNTQTKTEYARRR